MMHPPAAGGILARLTTGLARALMLAGGAMLLATAGLTTASVLRRWLSGQPIPGDFELVQLGSGLAIFGFLAWGSLSGAHILVDSFTIWLPKRAQQAIDAVWSLVFAAAAAALAERMLVGTLDTFASDTRTMVLSLSTWWVVGLGALAFAATALAALLAAARLLRGQEPSA